jgi:hypothetical protein
MLRKILGLTKKTTERPNEPPFDLDECVELTTLSDPRGERRYLHPPTRTRFRLIAGQWETMQ